MWILTKHMHLCTSRHLQVPVNLKAKNSLMHLNWRVHHTALTPQVACQGLATQRCLLCGSQGRMRVSILVFDLRKPRIAANGPSHPGIPTWSGRVGFEGCEHANPSRWASEGYSHCSWIQTKTGIHKMFIMPCTRGANFKLSQGRLFLMDFTLFCLEQLRGERWGERRQQGSHDHYGADKR